MWLSGGTMAMLAMMRCVSAYNCQVQIQIFSRYSPFILWMRYILSLALSRLCLVLIIHSPSLSRELSTSRAGHQAPRARERKGWYSENLNFCFLTESLSGNMHPAAASSLQMQSIMPWPQNRREKNVECCSKS